MNGSASQLSAPEEVFRPRRSEVTYVVLLVFLGGLLVGFWYLELNQILGSQITLGIDPDEVVKFSSIALGLGTLLLIFDALEARRWLLARGELRFLGSTLFISKGTRSLSFAASQLLRIGSYPGGAFVRLQFPETGITLPGQWLPPGWKSSWKGCRKPDGTITRLSRSTHPFLVALRARRPDLKPRLRLVRIVAASLIAVSLGSLVPITGLYPLYREARRAVGRQRTYDLAIKAFQQGNYLQACEEYRRALSDLKHDVYGSEHAAEVLLYCGDKKSAVKVAVGFDVQPLWPTQLEPEVLARIRIFCGRYSQAEGLLRGRPSYLLYVALSEQGRRAEAERILEDLAGKKGFTQVLLLRHRGRPEDAKEAAGTLCAAYGKQSPWTPSWLARRFESCMLSTGTAALVGDHYFASAIRSLPGLRDELVEFTRREAPQLEAGLESAFSVALRAAG